MINIMLLSTVIMLWTPGLGSVLFHVSCAYTTIMLLSCQVILVDRSSLGTMLYIKPESETVRDVTPDRNSNMHVYMKGKSGSEN